MSDTKSVTMETRYCTLCGPEAPKRQKYSANFEPEDLNAAIFSARRSPDKRHFRLVECGGCGIIYSDPACAASDLAALYTESAVNYDDQEAQIYDSYAPILDRAVQSLSRRGTFVEVGGGRGFMLRYAAENGFSDAVEIEPSSDAERRFVPPNERARFVRDIFVRGTLPAGSASLLCFFQMLDHLPNPLEFVQAVVEVLEPGGVAVCVTHDTSAVTARVLGESSPIYDIEHTYLFNRKNLGRLFEKAGLIDVSTFRVANDYALRYWLNMAPLPGPVKDPLREIFRVSGLGRLRFPLYMGNMGIIARKPDSPGGRSDS